MPLNVTMMTRTALMAAVTAVVAQIAIPLPFTPVPFTLQVLRQREVGASCIGNTNTPELQELPSLCGMKVQDKAFKEEFGGISCE
jgi:hypothetical protein